MPELDPFPNPPSALNSAGDGINLLFTSCYEYSWHVFARKYETLFSTYKKKVFFPNRFLAIFYFARIFKAFVLCSILYVQCTLKVHNDVWLLPKLRWGKLFLVFASCFFSFFSVFFYSFSSYKSFF